MGSCCGTPHQEHHQHRRGGGRVHFSKSGERHLTTESISHTTCSNNHHHEPGNTKQCFPAYIDDDADVETTTPEQPHSHQCHQKRHNSIVDDDGTSDSTAVIFIATGEGGGHSENVSLSNVSTNTSNHHHHQHQENSNNNNLLKYDFCKNGSHPQGSHGSHLQQQDNGNRGGEFIFGRTLSDVGGGRNVQSATNHQNSSCDANTPSTLLPQQDLPRIVGIMQSRGPLLRSEVLYLMELHALSAPYVEALNSQGSKDSSTSCLISPPGYCHNTGVDVDDDAISQVKRGRSSGTPRSTTTLSLFPSHHSRSNSHPHVGGCGCGTTHSIDPNHVNSTPLIHPRGDDELFGNSSTYSDSYLGGGPPKSSYGLGVDGYTMSGGKKNGHLFRMSQDPSSSLAHRESYCSVNTTDYIDSYPISNDSSPHANDPQLQRLIAESTKAVKRNWLMQRCWATIVDRESSGLEVSFVKLLHVAGSRIVGMERFDLFANLVERRQLFMDMMTQLFQTGLDATSSVYMLHQLGARHVAYGLTRQDYEAYTGPFVRTVVACARPGTVTPLVRSLMRKFWQRATEMMLEGAAQSRGSLSLKQAPKGAPFAIVFTDIEGSTALWENQPVAMEMAVDEHHKLVRDLIHDHNGYEVKTIGDSFMIAFKGLADAVTMALRLQVELLRASVEGLVIDGARCEASGPPEVWNPAALRVRAGVHWCTDATPKFDVVYKRYDYYGNDVNVAARVQDAACGGQVVCSASTYDALANLDLAAASKEDFTCGGLQSLDGNMSPGGSAKRPKASLASILGSSIYRSNVELSGLREPITIYSMYPKILAGRVYGERAAKRLYNGEGGAFEDIDNVC